MPRIPVPAFRPVLTAATVAVYAGLTALPVEASTGPTIGEIANQARPAQTAPQQAPQAQPRPLPGQRPLPTLGEIAAGGAAAPQARAGCTPPTLPTRLPEGGKATEAEMATAHTEFRRFVDEGQAFIACLDEAYKANAATITVGGYLALTEAHNRMVIAMEVLADGFNQELRAFRAKNKP